MTQGSLNTGVKFFHSYEDVQRLRGPWDELLSSQSATIEELDLTSGFDWAMALWESHLPGTAQEVMILRDEEGISGILPLYRFSKGMRGLPCRSLAPLSELYSGRTGLLVRNQRAETVDALLAALSELSTPWDALVLTVVKGSAYEQLLLEAAARQQRHLLTLSEERSPYIPFQESWAAHFASLPKKLRSTMRNGEKRLRERGELSYQECRTVEEVAIFNGAVNFIERDSWKAAAGTSIASNRKHEAFHRNLALRAAANGRFSGHLLLLNDEPVAYIMGLLNNGVFLDLKESYRASFREMSPGHVLKYFAFDKLYGHGTRVYDFMGKCEEYKLKWTDKLYCRSTYALLNNTFRGRAVYLADSFQKWRAAGKKKPDVLSRQPGGAGIAIQGEEKGLRTEPVKPGE